MTSIYDVRRVFKRLTETKAQELQDALSRGGAPDYSSYKMECGKICTLLGALVLLDEAIREVSNKDIDDDELEE